jgi:hypothetical protein
VTGKACTVGSTDFQPVILAFIDPFFSSGVHLAFTGGLSAAITIASSIRGDCSAEEAAAWHTQRVATSYTRYANDDPPVDMRLTVQCRFLVVVLSAYKQMTAQKENILSDIDEDNFDRAFKLFRPGVTFR